MCLFYEPTVNFSTRAVRVLTVFVRRKTHRRDRGSVAVTCLVISQLFAVAAAVHGAGRTVAATGVLALFFLSDEVDYNGGNDREKNY